MSNRVLVVEDNKIMREVMQHYLNGLKVNCYAVRTGKEAVELAEYFDLIFMDIDLPGIDGKEATRRIRAIETQKRLRPAVIVATTSGDNDLECLAAGMNEVCRKPLYRADVERLIRRWIITKPQNVPRQAVA
ncbi:MAG: response regulator [Candidatus Melainabacteria bacterium]|nr:response regulator [Candidatus Melainabacteria bacterium]MDX2105882.1 response regulator [Candidatus Melainabacteria bacterium]